MSLQIQWKPTDIRNRVQFFVLPPVNGSNQYRDCVVQSYFTELFLLQYVLRIFISYESKFRLFSIVCYEDRKK